MDTQFNFSFGYSANIPREASPLGRLEGLERRESREDINIDKSSPWGWYACDLIPILDSRFQMLDDDGDSECIVVEEI